MLPQLFPMLLGPFGRSQETLFFAVPGAIDDRATRTPSALRQLAQRLRFFEHGHLAAERIACAVHPCIVMISTNDPLISAIASRQSRDDAARRNDLPIEFEIQMCARRTGADVISDRQRATPVGRRYRTGDRSQKG